MQPMVLREGSVVNQTSPMPYYHQVAETLQEEIAGRQWRPGQRLPSEAELCRRFGVSRPVIRAALERLRQNGLIHKQRGVGSFVAKPKIQQRINMRGLGFFQEMQRHGLPVETVVWEQGVVTAPAQVARRLGHDGPVVRIVRLRKLQGEPVVFGTAYLPQALVPGLERMELANTSLYRLLQERYGLVSAHNEALIETVPSPGWVSDILSVAGGQPMFVLTGTSHLAEGQVFEVFEAWHRGDRFTLAFSSSAPGGLPGERSDQDGPREGGDRP